MILNVLSVSLSMSAVILGLYLIRKHINKRYSAKVMCMLWLFIALRMLVPVQIDLPVSRMNFDFNMDSTVTEVELPRMDTFEPEDNTIQLEQTISVEESVVPAVTFSISWQNVITCVWLAGVFFMVAKQGYAYFSISKWLKRNSVYYTSCDGYDVYLSTVLPEPLSFGGIKSSIYLTEAFKDDVWVLNHELTHCRHRDGLMTIISSLLKAIYWFNPLVYLLDKQWEADREMYCDETVLNGKSSLERKEYMVTLYDAAEAMTQQHLRFTSGLLDGEHQMVERFRQIASSTIKRKGKLLVVALASFIVIESSLIGCSSAESDMFKAITKSLENDKTKVGYITNFYFENEFYGYNGYTLAQYISVLDYDFSENQRNELEQRFNVENLDDQIQKDKEFMIEYDKNQRNQIINIINKMDFAEIESEKTKNLNFELTLEGSDLSKIVVSFYQGGIVTISESSMFGDQVRYYKTTSSVKELCELTLRQQIWMGSDSSPYHKYFINNNEEYRINSLNNNLKVLEKIGEMIE